MPNERPTDLYSTFGSADVNQVQQDGSGASAMRVEASPQDFGAQIGEAVQGAGKAVSQVSDDAAQYAQMATEAKANDEFANNYAPKAAALRQQFDQLDDKGKIAGYDNYISQLQAARQQSMDNLGSTYGRQLIGGQIDRHIATEIDSTSRDVVQADQAYRGQSNVQAIAAQTGFAASNLSDPKAVAQSADSIRGLKTLQMHDAGYDPTNPDHQAAIKYQADAAVGTMATHVIDTAVSSGNATAANQYRAQYGPFIPGYQALKIDNTLHVLNSQQSSAQNIEALKNGQPLPQPIGAPTSQVQAAVVKAAQSAGIDHNLALTTLHIESRDGQDLGSRGDIGQTGKGGNLDEQAANMTAALKTAHDAAAKTLGREPQPWEVYTCYQQGVAGGPALLKAVSDNPNVKAVDVLSSVYQTRKAALSAITNNGGNATMSASDFLSFLNKKYSDNAARASCDVPANGNLAGAIMAPHTTDGPAVQPTATPRDAWQEWQRKTPAMLERINAMPSGAMRNATLAAFDQQSKLIETSSRSYSGDLMMQAQKIAADPSFTDINSIPAETRAALQSDNPLTLNYMEQHAKENRERASGGASKDMTELGPAYFTLMRQIHAGAATNDDLLAHLPGGGAGDDLTMAGYKSLTEIGSPKNYGEQGDLTTRVNAFSAIHKMLSHQDPALGIADPEGEKRWQQALPILTDAMNKGMADKISLADLTDPKKPSWIGNSVASLRRTPVQAQIDLMHDSSGENSFGKTYQDYVRSTDPAQRAALHNSLLLSLTQQTRQATPAQREILKQQAVKLGIIAPDKTTAPVAQ